MCAFMFAASSEMISSSNDLDLDTQTSVVSSDDESHFDSREAAQTDTFVTDTFTRYTHR